MYIDRVVSYSLVPVTEYYNRYIELVSGDNTYINYWLVAYTFDGLEIVITTGSDKYNMTVLLKSLENTLLRKSDNPLVDRTIDKICMK